MITKLIADDLKQWCRRTFNNVKPEVFKRELYGNLDYVLYVFPLDARSTSICTAHVTATKIKIAYNYTTDTLDQRDIEIDISDPKCFAKTKKILRHAVFNYYAAEDSNT